MCGRYVVASRIEAIERRFSIRLANRQSKVLQEQFETFMPNYNLSAGNFGPVITSEKPRELQFFSFGFSPSSSDMRKCYLNTRSEGKSNKENNPNYRGAGVLQMRMWGEAFRKRRCIVIADAFIEGPEKEKLSKPYLCYLRNKKRPFALAGLWNYWTDKKTGEQIGTFSIMTTVTNEVTRAIGHHRSPVILEPHEAALWLDTSLDLNVVTNLLKPYPGAKMNAYPLSVELVKSGGLKDKSVIAPIGERVFKEFGHRIKTENRLMGMGTSPARKRRLEQDEEINRAMDKCNDPALDDDLIIP